MAAARGDLRRARRELRCAMRLDPENPRYRSALEELGRKRTPDDADAVPAGTGDIPAGP